MLRDGFPVLIIWRSLKIFLLIIMKKILYFSEKFSCCSIFMSELVFSNYFRCLDLARKCGFNFRLVSITHFLELISKKKKFQEKNIHFVFKQFHVKSGWAKFTLFSTSVIIWHRKLKFCSFIALDDDSVFKTSRRLGSKIES